MQLWCGVFLCPVGARLSKCRPYFLSVKLVTFLPVQTACVWCLEINILLSVAAVFLLPRWAVTATSSVVVSNHVIVLSVLVSRSSSSRDAIFPSVSMFTTSLFLFKKPISTIDYNVIRYLSLWLFRFISRSSRQRDCGFMHQWCPSVCLSVCRQNANDFIKN